MRFGLDTVRERVREIDPGNNRSPSSRAFCPIDNSVDSASPEEKLRACFWGRSSVPSRWERSPVLSLLLNGTKIGSSVPVFVPVPEFDRDLSRMPRMDSTPQLERF